MTPMAAALGAVFFVGLVGLAYLFVWHPVQQFLDLREDVKRRMAKFDTERARWKTSYDTEPLDSVLSKMRERHLLAAEHDFRELAVQMRSFAETQHLAGWILRKMQFDPGKAQAALSDLADAIALERAEHLMQQRSAVARASGG